MKNLILICTFLIAAATAYSQTIEYKNNIVYAELLGNGLFSSVNYERVISNNFDLRFGLGFAFSNSQSNSGSHHTTAFFPLAMANYLIDIYGDNYIEAGGGFLIASTDFEISDTFGPSMNVFVPTIAIGYRYSPKNGGVFFSAAFDMFLLESITPWGGLGIGYRFKSSPRIYSWEYITIINYASRFNDLPIPEHFLVGECEGFDKSLKRFPFLIFIPFSHS